MITKSEISGNEIAELTAFTTPTVLLINTWTTKTQIQDLKKNLLEKIDKYVPQSQYMSTQTSQNDYGLIEIKPSISGNLEQKFHGIFPSYEQHMIQKHGAGYIPQAYVQFMRKNPNSDLSENFKWQFLTLSSTLVPGRNLWTKPYVWTTLLCSLFVGRKGAERGIPYFSAKAASGISIKIAFFPSCMVPKIRLAPSYKDVKFRVFRNSIVKWPRVQRHCGRIRHLMVIDTKWQWRISRLIRCPLLI